MGTPELSVDGRRARRERGRVAVTDATIDLILDGEAPNVAAIARRARVSEATLFRYFESLDELLRATIDRYIERYLKLFLVPGLGRGPRDERIDRFVAARLRLFAATEPMARLSRSRASRVPELGDELRRMRTLFADQVRKHFAPELATLSPARRDDLVAVICALTSFESWLELRDSHGRGPVQVRRALTSSLGRLLGEAGDDRSEDPVTPTIDTVPVAFTPPGGWTGAPPAPILTACREPLPAGAPDLRGVWEVVEVLVDGRPVDGHGALGRRQRIEQAGDRLIVTAGGIVHDMRCDGTVEHGVHDVAELDKTTPITVVATYEDGVHVLRPVGIPVEVRRWREGDALLWQYVGFTARLARVSDPTGW